MEIVNGLSFDVEDWFQVENLREAISSEDWGRCELRVRDSTWRILRLLEANRTRATFFVLGWIAERCPSLVREIAAAGHEIASHGYGHELVHRHTVSSFHQDIRRSVDVLGSITGRAARGYRAPSFSITPKTAWALDALKDLGFLYDSSIFPTSFHNRYGFNGSSRFPFRFVNGLVEFPLSTFRRYGTNFPIAGGGYFRLFPYPLFRHLSRRLNRGGGPLIFYLHPWELDPGQPRVHVRYGYSFRHYVNLHKTEERLRMLLDDFRFAPLVELLEVYFPTNGGSPDSATASAGCVLGHGNESTIG